MAKNYSWIGDDCPPQWKRVGTIDVADPADVSWALDKGRRIGSIYDGRSGSVAEPCAADTYIEREDEPARAVPPIMSELEIAAMCGGRNAAKLLRRS